MVGQQFEYFVSFFHWNLSLIGGYKKFNIVINVRQYIDMTEDISWMTLRSTWIKQIRLREPLYYWGKLITISSTNKQELLKWIEKDEPQGRGLALPFTSLVCLFYKILMLCTTWKLYNDWLCFNFMKNKILHKTIEIEHFSLTFMKTALWPMLSKRKYF